MRRKPASVDQPWTALLTGPAAERARAVVAAIVDADRDGPARTGGRRSRRTDASVAGGMAGRAVLHWHAARGDRQTAAARALLDRSARALARHALTPELFGGVAGIAWAHAHLERHEAPDHATDLADIDELVLQLLAQPWAGSYDLVDGLVGFGVYGLERGPHAAGTAIVRQVIVHLAARSEVANDGRTWFTPSALVAIPPTKTPSPGHHNLGVAHGVPGILGFLGAACAAGHDGAGALLHESVPWLLARQRPADGTGAFAAWVEPQRASPPPARLAWCYGDAGIAAALLLAAQGADRDDWRRAALDLARCAAERSLESSGVRDAMFCHGAAGLAHTFNRLWQATGEPWLADAARTWIARTLAFARPGQGIAGFQSWDVDAERGGHWRTDTGLLTGTAGLGLVLLAAISDVEPEWDRLFLLSCRRQPRTRP